MIKIEIRLVLYVDKHGLALTKKEMLSMIDKGEIQRDLLSVKQGINKVTANYTVTPEGA